jgi:hypothetical protein
LQKCTSFFGPAAENFTWTGAPLNQGLRCEKSGLGSRSGQGERVRGILIAAEVALSLVLLAGAGLLMKSFIRLLSVDPGFNTRGLLTIDIELPENKYAEVAQRAEFVRTVLARLENVPGVSAAAAINVMPHDQEQWLERFQACRAIREPNSATLA